MKKTKIAILGGDLRQFTVAKTLHSEGFDINIFGLENLTRQLSGAKYFTSLKDTLSGVDYVILPLPASVNDGELNAPMSAQKGPIPLVDIVDIMPHNTCLLGGKLSDKIKEKAEGNGITCIDYFESEELQIKNAYTTAEAAISIAMNSLDKNLNASKIGITGFGRISKHLVNLLLSMKADVTVAARRSSDLSWAESLGCASLNIGGDHGEEALMEFQNGYDVIYNTVPCWLFGRDFLEGMDKDTFIIDLASAPGGVDMCAARELDLNVLWATSLPGKYAPQSAGTHISECIKKIIHDRGKAQ